MTPQDFVYWLQGVFEVTDPKSLNARQIEVIKRHLALVLKHETGDAKQAGLPKDWQKLMEEQWRTNLRPDPNSLLIC